MQPVKINVIRFQPPQRAFQRAINILAPVSARIRISRIGVKRKFRRQHHAIAQMTIGDKFPRQFFALPCRVAIRRIDEISAKLDVAIENRPRSSFIHTESPFGAKRHRTQAKRAHSQARTAQRHIFIQAHKHPSEIFPAHGMSLKLMPVYELRILYR